MKKYEFTGEVDYAGLKRIKRLSDGEIGGWIEGEKNLSHQSAAWVFDNARVSDDAQVFGNAQVYGDARVFGDARVYGNAQVFGDARVFGNAQVYGDAQVRCNARVYGDVQVFGNAWVFGNARVFGDVQVFGNAWVYGNAQVFDNARVRCNARVFGNAWVFGNARVYSDVQVFGNAWVFGPIKTATRTDGWTFSLLPCADGVWRISGECRFFTLDEAWEHWGRGKRANTPLGLESEDILVLFEHYIQRQPPMPVYKKE